MNLHPDILLLSGLLGGSLDVGQFDSNNVGSLQLGGN